MIKITLSKLGNKPKMLFKYVADKNDASDATDGCTLLYKIAAVPEFLATTIRDADGALRLVMIDPCTRVSSCTRDRLRQLILLVLGKVECQGKAVSMSISDDDLWILRFWLASCNFEIEYPQMPSRYYDRAWWSISKAAVLSKFLQQTIRDVPGRGAFYPDYQALSTAIIPKALSEASCIDSVLFEVDLTNLLREYVDNCHTDQRNDLLCYGYARRCQRKQIIPYDIVETCLEYVGCIEKYMPASALRKIPQASP